MIKIYDEQRRTKVNQTSIEDILLLTVYGEYSGLLVNDGVVIGVEIYHE